MLLRTLSTLTRRRTRRAGCTPSPATIRFADLQDGDAINRLYNDPTARPDATMPGYIPRTRAQWEWEFVHPSGRPSLYVVAEHDGRIVGTQACIPISFVIDGTLVETGKDEDTLVHPGHRGRGLLDAMYAPLASRAVADGIVLLWGFTSTAIRPLERNGYVAIGRNDSMASTSWKVPVAQDGAFEISEWNEPDARADRFSLEFSRRVGGIMPHLSEKFLRWRVLENPFREYKLFVAVAEDQVIGLSAFKLDPDGKVGYISELVGLDFGPLEESTVLRALLRPGLQLLQELNYRCVETRPSGNHPFNRRVKRLLGGLGFHAQPSDKATTFLVRPLRGSADQFLDQSHWRISEIMREY